MSPRQIVDRFGGFCSETHKWQWLVIIILPRFVHRQSNNTVLLNLGSHMARIPEDGTSYVGLVSTREYVLVPNGRKANSDASPVLPVWYRTARVLPVVNLRLQVRVISPWVSQVISQGNVFDFSKTAPSLIILYICSFTYLPCFECWFCNKGSSVVHVRYDTNPRTRCRVLAC